MLLLLRLTKVADEVGNRGLRRKEKGKAKGEGRGKWAKLNLQVGYLDICLCPFAVLFFTFPHACSLFSSALPLFSLECHCPESGYWWLSSVLSPTPATFFWTCPFIDASIHHLLVFLFFLLPFPVFLTLCPPSPSCSISSSLATAVMENVDSALHFWAYSLF